MPVANIHDIHSGSSASRMSPRVTMKQSIARAGTLCESWRSTLIDSAAPARKTKVGAQRCVIHRDRNRSIGSTVPGVYMNTASVMRCRPLKWSDA